jgi:hypothetical protein
MHGGEHMRRIAAVAATCLEPTARDAPLEQAPEPSLLRAACEQATMKRAEHRAIEATVGDLQAEEVFPVEAAAHRVRCLPVGEPLQRTAAASPGPAARGQGGLSGRGDEVGKRGIGRDGAQRITQLPSAGVIRDDRASHTGRFVGNRGNR